MSIEGGGGYGYFVSIAELERVIEQREGDKSGGAIFLEGEDLRIIRDEESEIVEGEITARVPVTVKQDGSLMFWAHGEYM